MDSELPHGVMFHHFCEDSQPNSLGAITPDQLENIIASYKKRAIDILPAEEWYQRALMGSLNKGQVCLTFDDALRSQINLALPVLEKHGLTAFWFVYSSVFEGEKSTFEIYRYFYDNYFATFDEFFYVFIRYLQSSQAIKDFLHERNRFLESDYLSEYPFYSDVEKEYRYFRDRVLSKEQFNQLMENILADYEVSYAEISKNLWMTNDHLLDLVGNSHIVGLHSYSHPTSMSSLNVSDQMNEYQRNAVHLHSVIGRPVRTVAHPVNSYGKQTLRILESMGIMIGFRSNMHKKSFGPLEQPRADCNGIWH